MTDADTPLKCECGGTPTLTTMYNVLDADEPFSYSVKCERCGMRTGKFQKCEEAVAAWNRKEVE